MSHTRMTTLIFILSELFPLIVKATMPSILNTVRNIFMTVIGIFSCTVMYKRS